MNRIELNIIALTKSESTPGNYALILEEYGGFRRLPVIIGPFEAQAIAVALEQMQPVRPLTHDLFKLTLDAAGVKIREVVIAEMVNNIFYAHIIVEAADGTSFEIDARSSDAIAMAVRFLCPIYTTEEVMNKAGIVLDSPSKAFTNKKGALANYSLEELKQLLERVLEKEDYESASKVRDAIRKKEEGDT